MTDRLLTTFSRLRDFIESKSPFYEHHLLELTLDEQAYNDYRTHWLAEREFFQAQTGHANASWDCLAPWVGQHEQELVGLPQANRSTLAIWAAGTFQDSLVDVLLENDRSLALLADEHGDMPLHAAAASQSLTLFPKLFEDNPRAARTTLNQDGYTPLQVLLSARDAGPEARWPVRFGQGKHTQCLRWIQEHHPKLLNQAFPDGSTALHLTAALQRPMGPSKIVLQQDTDWQRPDAQGMTPAQVLAANTAFQPNPFSKSAERRREARWREEILDQHLVAAPVVQPKSRLLGWFRR